MRKLANLSAFLPEHHKDGVEQFQTFTERVDEEYTLQGGVRLFSIK